MKKFPHLVQLHRKLSDQGLVCVSLEVYPQEWEMKDKITDFLKKQEATFANFIFKDANGKADDWLVKNDATALPTYVLFDRAGKRVNVPDEKPDAVEKQVAELLDAK